MNFPAVSLIREGLARHSVPPHLREGLVGYLCEGYLPGRFLTCVLENDLAEAVMRADSVSIASLSVLVQFLNMEAPASAWGSPAKVQAWGLLVTAPHERATGGGERDIDVMRIVGLCHEIQDAAKRRETKSVGTVVCAEIAAKILRELEVKGDAAASHSPAPPVSPEE